MPVATVSHASKQAYEAEIKRLDLEERRGELVSAASVRSDMATLGAEMKTGLGSIRDRIVGDLAGMTDVFAIGELLDREFER